MRNDLSIEEYERLFCAAKPEHVVRVDASTSYLTQPTAIKRILEYRSDPKFIVLLRNPVDLSYSLHSETLYRGGEEINDFREAWRLQGKRRTGKNIPRSCQNRDMLLYYEQSLLGHALDQLLKYAGRSCVHWMFVEDLGRNPGCCYRALLGFLGLEDDGRKEFPHLNKSKRHRFPRLNRATRILGRWRAKSGLPGLGVRDALNRYARVEAERPPLSEEFRWELYQAFYEDIRLLSRLTGRDRSHWTPTTIEGNSDAFKKE